MPNGAPKNDDIRLQAAVMVSAGMPYQQIADKLQIHKRTVGRWVAEDEEFQEMLRELRRETLDKASGQLAECLGEAVATLRRAMTSKNVHAEVRAAIATFELYLKVGEQSELRDRLSDLEEALKDRQEPWR